MAANGDIELRRNRDRKELSSMSEFPTLQDLVWAAREKLPRPVWDFVTFGSESETTLRRNRRALDSLAFLPRIMRDVSEVDPRTELLGLPLRIPVLLAP